MIHYDQQVHQPAGPELSLNPAFAGAAATFSGIGLARFAYVPLFPAMVAAGWVTGAEGGFLGAMNLAGYLIGVLGGRGLAARLGTARALDAGMALVGLAFAACAWNGGVAWLAVWRLLAGLAGGALMALAGPAVLRRRCARTARHGRRDCRDGSWRRRHRRIRADIFAAACRTSCNLARSCSPCHRSVDACPSTLAPNSRRSR
jgi:hypothetical protein